MVEFSTADTLRANLDAMGVMNATLHDENDALRQRVAAELKTTFASHYTQVISLAQMLQPEVIALYNQRATGTKLLVNPSLGLAD